MSEDQKTKDNVVGIGDNNTYSKEQYEKLLSHFHWVVDYVKEEIFGVERLFDEAFTGYKYPQRFDKKKLKPFEVHEKRHLAKGNTEYLIKSLNKEIETIEAKAIANDLKLEKVEDRKAAEAECARINAKEAAEDAS